MEIHDFIRKEIFENRVARTDANRTRSRRTHFRQAVFRFVQKPERALHFRKNYLAALRGKLHTAARAVKQAHAKLRFQLFNRLRNRWLRNV